MKSSSRRSSSRASPTCTACARVGWRSAPLCRTDCADYWLSSICRWLSASGRLPEFRRSWRTLTISCRASRCALHAGWEHYVLLGERIAAVERQIEKHAGSDERAKRIMAMPGIGPLTASAVVAAVGDAHEFKNARQFSAWLGLTPRQNSSGGKTQLGAITKRGDIYIRMLLVLGARSALMSAARRTDRISRWLLDIEARLGWRKALVALANKHARIIWSVLTRKADFDPNHVPPCFVMAGR